jgi:hypothetical protein
MTNSKSRSAAIRSALLKRLDADYGPLMAVGDIAEMFRISRESFGNTLRTSPDPRIQFLRRSKIRLGRRVRFPTDAVVSALLGPDRTKSVSDKEVADE